MARRVYKRGRVVYWPDQLKVERPMLIRADAEPKDEIYRFIHAIVLVYLNKYRVFSYRAEDIDDLVVEAEAAAYSRLLYMVRNKLYDRRYSFYLNVRSAVWSSISRVVERFTRQQEQAALTQSSYCADGAGMLFDLCNKYESHKLPRLLTESDHNRKRQCFDWRTAKRHAQTRILRRIVNEEYAEYCELCGEIGREPELTLDEYLRKNFKPDEVKIYYKKTYSRKS